MQVSLTKDIARALLPGKQMSKLLLQKLVPKCGKKIHGTGKYTDFVKKKI